MIRKCAKTSPYDNILKALKVAKKNLNSDRICIQLNGQNKNYTEFTRIKNNLIYTFQVGSFPHGAAMDLICYFDSLDGQSDGCYDLDKVITLIKQIKNNALEKNKLIKYLDKQINGYHKEIERKRQKLSEYTKKRGNKYSYTKWLAFRNFYKNSLHNLANLKKIIAFLKNTKPTVY